MRFARGGGHEVGNKGFLDEALATRRVERTAICGDTNGRDDLVGPFLHPQQPIRVRLPEGDRAEAPRRGDGDGAGGDDAGDEGDAGDDDGDVGDGADGDDEGGDGDKGDKGNDDRPEGACAARGEYMSCWGGIDDDDG